MKTMAGSQSRCATCSLDRLNLGMIILTHLCLFLLSFQALTVQRIVLEKALADAKSEVVYTTISSPF